MATIKDVAKLAGVSPSTVSIVVNGKQDIRKISAETQEKVRKAILKLNYQPNVSAKRLRNNIETEYMIAVYWASDARAISIGRLIKGIQETAELHHYPVNIIIRPYKNDHLCEEPGLKTKDFFHAAIIANTSAKDMEYLESFTPIIPTVLYNRYSENYNTVSIDFDTIGEKLLSKICACSYQRIGIAAMENPYLGVILRRKSFMEACAKRHIKIAAQDIVTSKSDSVPHGFQVAEELLTHASLPDVLYCESDGIAQGILQAFHKHRIAVPKKIGVVSICLGIPEVCQLVTPPLTTIEIPIEKIAKQCMDLIVRVLENKAKTPCHEHCTIKYVKRESL